MIRPIKIQYKKKNLIFTFIGGGIFVALGLWLVIKQPSISNPILGNPVVIFFIAVLSIIFFGSVAVFAFKKLFNGGPGITINSQGIIDDVGILPFGLIFWQDIQEVEVIEVRGQKFISLILKNPEEYILKEPNPILRISIKINYKWYGSPILISFNDLEYDFDELYKLITERHKEYYLQSESKKNDTTNRKTYNSNSESYHFSILKIKPEATIEEIKKAYKDEIKKYHPDKVEHLGDEFKTIADKKSKEINKAYNYFRNKYNFV